MSEGKTADKHIPMSDDIRIYAVHHNEPCDMLRGPCCCGAWHTPSDFDKEFMRRFGTTATRVAEGFDQLDRGEHVEL
jgi:hypothetical protein